MSMLLLRTKLHSRVSTGCRRTTAPVSLDFPWHMRDPHALCFRLPLRS